ncbi:hypothetical protein [Saccharothrix australiensis]|uniref:Uncharacterized protein n=1 Tax=Saccharothrix australiensis TaxID=2072 RepID=A0A495VJC4_9PSEU|nr:hypothetical protein [Saccharothrix australiensis]RKT49352.1 hypothetical protein C8E97_6731 [Saccharothrix australiensis]
MQTIRRPQALRRWLPGAAAVAGHAVRLVRDYGTAVGGVAALSWGAAQVYGPAGWITLGALLLADRVVDDHRAARERSGGER